MVNISNFRLSTLVDPYAANISPRGAPIFQDLRHLHRQAFEEAVRENAEEIDLGNLPRLDNPKTMKFYMSRSLASAFIWSPEGTWTGLARVPALFETFDRHMLKYVRREIDLNSGETHVFRPPLAIGVHPEIKFRCKAWLSNYDARYEPMTGRPEIQYALMFEDYKQQAHYAWHVEDTL